jgi:hypothetical protein
VQERAYKLGIRLARMFVDIPGQRPPPSFAFERRRFSFWGRFVLFLKGASVTNASPVSVEKRIT